MLYDIFDGSMHEIYHTYVSFIMKINAHQFGSNCIVIVNDSHEFNKVQIF
jgi:hypothetical protein